MSVPYKSKNWYLKLINKQLCNIYFHFFKWDDNEEFA